MRKFGRCSETFTFTFICHPGKTHNLFCSEKCSSTHPQAASGNLESL